MTEVFDKDAALERVGDDTELLKELVSICQSEFSAKIPELRAALASGDTKAVSEIAHSLKSAFGNVGAMLGHQSAFNLEMASKKGNAAELGELISKFERAVGEFFLTFKEEEAKLP